MYILTAVRTSLGPVYLVPHGTVIPPGDGSQSTRCEPPPGVLPQWRWKHRPAASATITFIPYYLDKRDWHEDTYVSDHPKLSVYIRTYMYGHTYSKSIIWINLVRLPILLVVS